MDQLQERLAEIHQIIFQLKSAISSGHFFELGAEPEPISKMTECAALMDEKLSDLDSLYKEKPMKQANAYYKLLQINREMLAYYTSVKKEGKGSIEKTDRAKAYIARVEELLTALAKTASISLFPYEKHLNVLDKILKGKNLPQNHPAWKRFARLSQNLRDVYQQGLAKEAANPVIAEFDAFLLGLELPNFMKLPILAREHESSNDYVPPVSEPIPVEKCWALFVGVGNYQNEAYGTISYAANDAKQLAELLGKTSRYNPDQMWLFSTDKPDHGTLAGKIYKGPPNSVKIIQLFNQTIRRKVGEADLFLFYFSGHGFIDDNDSPYMLTQESIPDQLDQTAILVEKIHNKIHEVKARVKVIIVDMCHAGTMIASKSVKPWNAKLIERMYDAAEGTVILTSCKPNENSFKYDGGGEPTSAFTHFLIEGIEQGAKSNWFVTAHDLQMYVTNAVIDWSIEHQTPQTPQVTITGQGDPIIADWRKQEKSDEPDMV